MSDKSSSFMISTSLILGPTPFTRDQLLVKTLLSKD